MKCPFFDKDQRETHAAGRHLSVESKQSVFKKHEAVTVTVTNRSKESAYLERGLFSELSHRGFVIALEPERKRVSTFSLYRATIDKAERKAEAVELAPSQTLEATWTGTSIEPDNDGPGAKHCRAPGRYAVQILYALKARDADGPSALLPPLYAAESNAFQIR